MDEAAPLEVSRKAELSEKLLQQCTVDGIVAENFPWKDDLERVGREKMSAFRNRIVHDGEKYVPTVEDARIYAATAVEASGKKYAVLMEQISREVDDALPKDADRALIERAKDSVLRGQMDCYRMLLADEVRQIVRSEAVNNLLPTTASFTSDEQLALDAVKTDDSTMALEIEKWAAGRATFDNLGPTPVNDRSLFQKLGALRSLVLSAEFLDAAVNSRPVDKNVVYSTMAGAFWRQAFEKNTQTNK